MINSADILGPEDFGGANKERTKRLEASIATWADGIRESFGKNRKDYNFVVCDQLAAAGITPTAHNVLRVGRWGQNLSVAGDVAQWYRTLASRLHSLESSIPMAARKQANTLLDQLFAIASKSAQDAATAIMDEQLRPLRDQVNELQASLAASQLATQDSEQKLSKKASELDAMTLELSASHESKRSIESTLEDVNCRFNALVHNHALLQERLSLQEKTSHQEIAELQKDALKIKESCARELLSSQEKADNERRRLMLVIDSERTDHGKQIKLAQVDVNAARDRLDALRTENTNLAVDKAKAQASLIGAEALLNAQAQRFDEEKKHYQSDAYKHQSLILFAQQARHLGILQRPGSDMAIMEWLEKTLGMTTDNACKIMQGFDRVKTNSKNQQ